MQVKKESFVKLTEEIKVAEKQVRALLKSETAEPADYLNAIKALGKLLKKVIGLEKK